MDAIVPLERGLVNLRAGTTGKPQSLTLGGEERLCRCACRIAHPGGKLACHGVGQVLLVVVRVAVHSCDVPRDFRYVRSWLVRTSISPMVV